MAVQASLPACRRIEVPADVESTDEPAVDVEPEAEAEEELSFDEPWLDTAMCTTCDDCMGINKMMFTFTTTTSRRLSSDPEGRQLSPISWRRPKSVPPSAFTRANRSNPNEAGLEELMARAEPFN